MVARINYRYGVVAFLTAAVAAGCTETVGPSARPTLMLAGGAAETRTREVAVSMIAPGASEVRLGEERIDTATFQPIGAVGRWVLSAGDGPRTVLMQARYPSGGVSDVVTDEIVLSEHAYASPDGDDADAGTYLAPKRSVGAALAAAVAEGRGRVRLFAGVYSPTTTGDAFPIAPPSELVLEAVEESGTVLDAEEAGGVLVFDDVSGSAVRGLVLQGGVADSGGGAYVIDSDVLFENLVVRQNVAVKGSGFYFGAGAEVVLRWSVVAFNESAPDADAHGLHVVNGAHAVVHNNTVAFHDSNGILVAGPSIIDMRNNIVYVNGDAALGRGRGICELSNPHRSIVRYNLFYGNTVAPFLLGGVGDITAEHANDAWLDDGIVANFEADPRFVDAEAGDFRLLTDSPAIDAGDPNPAYNDADGSRNDVGQLGGR